jgi:5S rRNA maturation endonuclease (ribonuclease M5)
MSQFTGEKMDLATKNAYDQVLREHVIEHLSGIGGRIRGPEMLIICPFHDDTNPSLRVHIGNKLTPGSYYCFSCKAHGGWNQLAEKLKMPPIGNQARTQAKQVMEQNPFGLLSDSIKQQPALTDVKIRTLIGTEALPTDFKWRGLGKAFLEKYGAKFYWEREIDMDYLYFPLTMHGMYVGYTIAALRPHKPKYETFADTHKTWFCYDQVRSDEAVVIVEGHHDTLRMQSEGINTLGLFGTTNWSPAKKASLLAKNPKRVIILMDGDEAGYKAAVEIYNDLIQGVEVQIVYLPHVPNKTLDPGNMPTEWVEYIRGLCEV